VVYHAWLDVLENMRRFLVITMIGLMFCACSGIRYSEIAPGAKDFHPRRIGILPVDVGTYANARGVIDRIFADVLTDSSWFASVSNAEMVNKQILANEETGKVVLDYVSKLKTVNYSDPELSKKVGELLKIDAFLVVDLIYWNYTKIEDDRVAKVEVAATMINANTGQILWNAHHHEAEKYTFFQPQLPDVAKNMVKKMIAEMPH
jgi:hypothetical protein